jgi:hypothetical protein
MSPSDKPTYRAALDIMAEARRLRVMADGEPYKHAAEIAADGGPMWDPDTVRGDFIIIGFSAPYVIVKRIADGKLGTLEFIPSPRRYFSFVEDRP